MSYSSHDDAEMAQDSALVSSLWNRGLIAEIEAHKYAIFHENTPPFSGLGWYWLELLEPEGTEKAQDSILLSSLWNKRLISEIEV